MSASYDIETIKGFKDLVNGGVYSVGLVDSFSVYGQTNMLIAPQPIYFAPDGVLSSNTTELFISHNALVGKYNGVIYTSNNFYPLIQIQYGDHNINIGLRGEIEGNNNYISRLSLIEYDADNPSRTYGGVYGAYLSTRAKEDPNYLFLLMYEWIRPNTGEVVYTGRIDCFYGNDRLDYDGVINLMLTEHKNFGAEATTVWTKNLTIDGTTYPPTEYEEERGSGEGGGDGDLDTSSDTIDFPVPPVITGISTGLITMYNPTVEQLRAFNAYLWSNDVFTTIQKFISSPMDLIISLSIVPVAVPTGNTAPIKIGGINTGASALVVSNQFMTFDCGTINVNEFYGSSLDYGIYTKLSIYLPYIGVRELKTDEIMGGTVQIKYNIDLLTGTCVAMVKCTRQMLEAVLYTFEGNISAQLPINARDFMSLYGSIARGVIDTAVQGFNPVSVVQSALSVMSSKPQVNRSGIISANGGHLSVHKPYLIIERAIQSVPSNASQFYGSPSNITARLGELRGYTEVDYIIETDIHCTLDEFEEINTLLKEGVYL